MLSDLSRLASQTGRDIAAAWERGDDLDTAARVAAERIEESFGPAVDALRQWQHAERIGDAEEIENAKIARDLFLETL